MKKVILIAVVGLILFLIFNYAYTQERITLSTYYPAPYGEYRKLAIGSSTGGYVAPSSSNIDLVVEGGVGIGTTSPGAKLDVNGNIALSGGTGWGTSVIDRVAIGGNSFTEIVGENGVALRDGFSGTYLIQRNGNVGIGTTSPGAVLDVDKLNAGPIALRSNARYNAAKSYAGYFVNTYDNNLGNVALYASATNAAGSAYGLIVENGNVGIGTTSPGAKLHVGGAAGTDGIMFPDGTLQKTAAGGFGNTLSRNENTTYQAATDGFFIGTILHNDANGDFGAHITAYSDSGSSPTTVMGYASIVRTRYNLDSRGLANSFCVPVKSGNYYRATYTNDKNSPVTTRTYKWIPIGV